MRIHASGFIAGTDEKRNLRERVCNNNETDKSAEEVLQIEGIEHDPKIEVTKKLS